MTLVTYLLATSALALALGGVSLINALVRVCDGYEDATGFHYGAVPLAALLLVPAGSLVTGTSPAGASMTSQGSTATVVSSSPFPGSTSLVRESQSPFHVHSTDATKVAAPPTPSTNTAAPFPPQSAAPFSADSAAPFSAATPQAERPATEGRQSEDAKP